MLKTCLKHDLRALRRECSLISLAVLTATVVATIVFRFCSEFIASPPADPDTAALLSMLSSIAMIAGVFSVFVLIATLVAPTVIGIWRMYTHFYTDQGYLTFTLPVKRSTLYLSKVISTLILQAVAFAELLISVALLCLIVPPTSGNGLIDPVNFVELGDFLSLVWNDIGLWLILWILLGIVQLVALALVNMGLFNFCLTVGCIVAKKHKILASIGIFYAFNMVYSFITSFGSLFLFSGLLSATNIYIMNDLLGPAIAALLLLSIALSAVVALAFHFTTLSRIERKLNLA